MASLRGRLERLRRLERVKAADLNQEMLCREAVRRLTDSELKAFGDFMERHEGLPDDRVHLELAATPEEEAAYARVCEHLEEVRRELC